MYTNLHLFDCKRVYVTEVTAGRKHNKSTRPLLSGAGLFLAAMSLAACAHGGSRVVGSTMPTRVALAPTPTYDCTIGYPIIGNAESTKDSIGIQVSSGQYPKIIPDLTVRWGDRKESENKPYYTSDDFCHTYSAGRFVVTAFMRVPGRAEPIPCGSTFSVTINPNLPPVQSVTVEQQ